MTELVDYLNPDNYQYLTKRTQRAEKKAAQAYEKEYTETINAMTDDADVLADIAERIRIGTYKLAEFFYLQGNQEEYIFFQGEPRNAKIKRARDMRLRYWHMLEYFKANIPRLEAPMNKESWIADMIHISVEGNRAENLAFALEALVEEILNPPKVKKNPLLEE